jgi:hypothetical protein
MLVLLDQIGSIAVPAALIIGFLAMGAWALAPFRAKAGGSRGTLVVAIVIGAVAGIAAAGLVDSYVGGLACFDTEKTAACYEVGLAPAVVAGLLIALAAVVGFAVLARLGATAPLVGSILGPVLLVVVVIAASAGLAFVHGAAGDEAQRQQAAALADRSAVLHATVSNVQASTGTDPNVVIGVRLRLVLHADSGIDLAGAGKLDNPRFVLSPPNGPGVDATGATPTSAFGAGTDTIYDLAFDTAGIAHGGGTDIVLVSTYQAPTFGTWTLRIDIEDTSGTLLQKSIEVTVGAAPATPS